MRQIISVFILMLLALSAMAQDAIKIQEPFRASFLSGMVVDQTGSELPGILVERLSLDKTSAQDERVTDAKGSFSFSGITQGKHSLKLSKPGWSAMHVTVVVDKKAKGELNLTMHIAR
jgi:carboxypeptidase family protein